MRLSQICSFLLICGHCSWNRSKSRDSTRPVTLDLIISVGAQGSIDSVRYRVSGPDVDRFHEWPCREASG